MHVGNERAKELLHHHRIEKLLVVEGTRLVGLITIKDLLQADRNPDANKDDGRRLRVGAAVGPGVDSGERVDALVTDSELAAPDRAELSGRGVEVVIAS